MHPTPAPGDPKRCTLHPPPPVKRVSMYSMYVAYKDISKDACKHLSMHAFKPNGHKQACKLARMWANMKDFIDCSWCAHISAALSNFL